MTIKKLTPAQITMLKGYYIDKYLMENEGRSATYEELANADTLVSDEMLMAEYRDTDFSEDDFLSTEASDTSSCIVDETAVLDVITNYRDFDKVVRVILDDEELYADFCCMMQIAPTDGDAQIESALISYLVDTLAAFDYNNPDHWWMDACKECLANRLRMISA